MCKTLSSIIIIGLWAISCKNDLDNYPPPTEISILSDTVPKRSISQIISYGGSLELKSIPYKVAGIENFIVTADHYIVFDSHRGDQEKIYVVDKKTGQFLHEIFIPKSATGELAGIRNVCYDPNSKKLFALGYKCIFEFDINGKLSNILPIGVDGNRMIVMDNGNLLLEISPNEEDASNYHHIVILNKKGEILSRLLPYKPQGKSFIVKEMGLLKKTERGILYSKPFGDTLYQLKGEQMIPLIALDFGDKRVSRDESLNIDRLLGGGLSDRSYIRSDAEVADDLLVFSYLNPDQDITFGFFDFTTGEFTNSRNTLRNDEMAFIMKYGQVLGKDGDRLVFEMSPKQASGLIAYHKQEMERLKKANPNLYELIQNTASTKTAALLYFNLSKNEP